MMRCKWVLGLLLAATMVVPAAWGHEQVEGLGDVLHELKEHGMLKQPFDGRTASDDYIVLNDGTAYSLDSEFWRATEQMLSFIPKKDGSSLDESVLFGTKVKNFVLRWTDWRTYLYTSTSGLVLFNRHGLSAGAMIGLGEGIEHTLAAVLFALTGIPLPPMCWAIQTGCVMINTPVQEVANAAWYRQPIDEPVVGRVDPTIRTMWARFQMLRLLRMVYSDLADGRTFITSKWFYARKQRTKTDPAEDFLLPSIFWRLLLQRQVPEKDLPLLDWCGTNKGQPKCLNHSHGDGIQVGHFRAEDANRSPDEFPIEPFLRPLDFELPFMARLLSSEEQLAYLNLQIDLSEAAILTLKGDHPFVTAYLRYVVSKAAGRVHRYGLILRQLARNEVSEKTHANAEILIQQFVQGFLGFQTDLSDFVESTQNGLIPWGTPLAKRMSGWSKIAKHQLKEFQTKATCELRLVR